ncbi:hypothetical protein GCM10022222_81950 [Amycolatopsis ultiminotia]|uniref:3,4-dihydroxy-2-butanone-4-phosphate synthase n=1 Tax=Amycolatopsis ultiminotia TaxID=543629 RepID=A0ABP6YM31_9PSEU
MTAEIGQTTLDPAEGRVRRVLDRLAAGLPVILVDDVRGAGEGALVLPAEAAVPRLIAFLVKHTTGFLRVPMEEAACDRLGLPPMRPRSGHGHCVTVDAAGAGTGISATDRARTIALLARSDAEPDDFTRPGHVVPVRANVGGVLVKQDRAEAVVDLMRLAGLRPAGVFAEIVGSSRTGALARGPALYAFACGQGLAQVSISEIAERRLRAVWAGQ